MIRAWLEVGEEPVLKVRVCERTETGTLRTIGTASSVEAACRIVGAWLAQLVGPEPPVPDSRPAHDA